MLHTSRPKLAKNRTILYEKLFKLPTDLFCDKRPIQDTKQPIFLFSIPFIAIIFEVSWLISLNQYILYFIESLDSILIQSCHQYIFPLLLLYRFEYRQVTF